MFLSAKQMMQWRAWRISGSGDLTSLGRSRNGKGDLFALEVLLIANDFPGIIEGAAYHL